MQGRIFGVRNVRPAIDVTIKDRKGAIINNLALINISTSNC